MEIRPIRLKKEYYSNIEKDLNKVFYENIYSKIEEFIDKYFSDYYNAKTSELMKAINEGKIQYIDGQFHGKRSSILSREIKALGGHFNRKAKTWGIARSKLPLNVQSAIAIANTRFERLHNELAVLLGDMYKDDISVSTSISSSIANIDRDLDKTVKDMHVMPKLTADMRDRFTKEYNKNMNLYVKSFKKKHVLRLREMVEENASSGYRASGLVKTIKDSFNTTKSKAEFLAKQETRLFMSKYKQERYRDVGITKFKWSTSKDGRVREDHKLLDGKVFRYDTPPVVDRETGKTALPSQDFGCRCVDIPIVE